MKIKNFQELVINDLRKTALQIAEAGLEAIDTEKIMKENIRLDGDKLFVKNKSFFLNKLGRIFVIGVGKCSLEAAAVLEDVLKERVFGGIVIDVHEGKELKKIKKYLGDHPFPSERNINATKEIISLLADMKENDLVIFIVSGGGSTLLCQPTNFTCNNEKQIMECLFKVGAEIEEINTIRKHISIARGGFLAKYAYPAQVVGLIFSDVPGDKTEFIASGPTVKDGTTISDADRILDKYGICEKCGFLKKSLTETPKDDKYFERVENILIVSNRIALDAMRKKSEEPGFSVKICSVCLSGEARKVGEEIVNELKKAPPKTVLLYGGETTVNVVGQGKGGRNQELALSALSFIGENEIIVSIASDGKDNTKFAGALCDAIIKKKSEKLGLNAENYLSNNDSLRFFEKIGDYILTGDTGSNVSDLVIAIKN